MTSIVKFFAGILLVQVLTAAQLLLAWRSQQPEVWLMVGLFAVSTGFLAALWLSSLVKHASQDAVSKATARFSRERERVRTQAEQEKAKVVAQTHQEIARARSRAEARANIKVGAAVTAVVGAGGLLLLTQFVTLGLLALSSAGGAVGGYLLRLRQEQQRRERQIAAQLIGPAPSAKLIEGEAEKRLARPAADAPELSKGGARPSTARQRLPALASKRNGQAADSA